MLMPLANALASEADPVAWLKGVEQRFAGHHVRVDRRVKMLADRAFCAQNLRMNLPGYSDGHVGKWITGPAALTAQIEPFWEAGFSLHIHVNGDDGLDVVRGGIAANRLTIGGNVRAPAKRLSLDKALRDHHRGSAGDRHGPSGWIDRGGQECGFCRA